MAPRINQSCPCGWRKKCFCNGPCTGKAVATVSLNMNLSTTQTAYGKKATSREGGSLTGSFTGEYLASQNSETGEISVSGDVAGSKCVTTASGTSFVTEWEDDVEVSCGVFSCPTCCQPGPLGTYQYIPTGSCGGGGSCAQTSDCVITFFTGTTYQNFSVGFSYKVSKEGQISNFVWGVRYSGPDSTATDPSFGYQIGTINLSISGGPSGQKALFGSGPVPSIQTLTGGGSISITLDKEG